MTTIGSVALRDNYARRNEVTQQGSTARTGETNADAGALSAAQEMELFKQKLLGTLAGVQGHPTVKNVAIDISEAGFKAMKEDLGYRDKVLKLISRDVGSSYAPCDASVLIHVGPNLDCYRADS